MAARPIQVASRAPRDLYFAGAPSFPLCWERVEQKHSALAKASASGEWRTANGEERHCPENGNLFYHCRMCRNIKPLFNFDPPVTPEEVRNASLQFVRKISGFSKPSKANEAAFNLAIDEIAAASMRLLSSLETTATPKNREEEAAKAKARSAERFSA